MLGYRVLGYRVSFRIKLEKKFDTYLILREVVEKSYTENTTS